MKVVLVIAYKFSFIEQWLIALSTPSIKLISEKQNQIFIIFTTQDMFSRKISNIYFLYTGVD